jgi:DNA repair exonuclease SbcCD ATPase subunit
MIQSLRHRLEQEKGRLTQVLADKDQAQNRLDTLAQDRLRIEQGILILQTVAEAVQGRLSYFINDNVTAAIEAVFPDDDWAFLLEFVQRRGSTEADLWLVDPKGNRIRPKDAEGGGLVNVVAFALRVALWSLSKSSRPVFLLDEPFHFLHGRGDHARVAELLRTISEGLGLQIIMVTGEDESEEIVAGADKVFEVRKIKGVSQVRKRQKSPAPGPLNRG